MHIVTTHHNPRRKCYVVRMNNYFFYFSRWSFLHGKVFFTRTVNWVLLGDRKVVGSWSACIYIHTYIYWRHLLNIFFPNETTTCLFCLLSKLNWVSQYVQVQVPDRGNRSFRFSCIIIIISAKNLLGKQTNKQRNHNKVDGIVLKKYVLEWIGLFACETLLKQHK